MQSKGFSEQESLHEVVKQSHASNFPLPPLAFKGKAKKSSLIKAHFFFAFALLLPMQQWI